MTTPVVFPDPERLVVDVLKAAIASTTIPYLLDDLGDPATVSTSYPDGSTGAPDAPHIQVRHDGTPAPGRFVEGSLIGVTVWYPLTRRTDAKAAASWTGAILAAQLGWNAVPASGRLPGVDADSQLYYVGAEWRIRLKGASVA